MSDTSRIRLSALGRNAPRPVEIVPDPETRAALSRELDLVSLRKLRLSGELVPQGRNDWRLEATLGATLVQACGVTLEPVTTRIDDPVLRTYVADLDPAVPAAEQEMPEDDTIEPLPDTLDLMAVLTEALMLSIPPFPRAAGAEFGQATASRPGTQPVTEDDLKPFAGLRDVLKDAGN